MFPQKELNRIERRKKAIIAHSDILREECGEIFSAVSRRAQRVEQSLGGGRSIHPVVAVVVTTGLLFLKARYLPKRKYLAPLFSMADTALHASRR